MLKLLVIGNLGKDALVNNVNGKSVINFSVAHTEKYKDAQGNQQSKTTWVECAWWSDRSGVVPYLKKGVSVYVEGNPEVKTFSKSDGTTGTILVLRVGMLQLLGGGSNGNTAPQAQQSNGNNYGGTPQSANTDDDLPF